MSGDEARTGTPKGGATDPADAARKRWTLATGIVSWLAAIIAPALSFDVALGMNSDAGPQYQAYLLILSAALFLLAWRAIGRLRGWMLGLLALASVASFVAYNVEKDEWTCVYFPARFDNLHFTMGTELLPAVAQQLRAEPPADSSCQTLMAPWGGDAMQMWERNGVERRFLTLFALYAFAWLSLALLVLGAVHFSLRTRPDR